MDQWIFGIVPAVIFAAALLLQQAAGTKQPRSKRTLNYGEPKIISSTNDDYDGNPGWAYAKPRVKCYSCYMSDPGTNCLTLKDKNSVAVEACDGIDDHCMVHKLMENGDLTTFSRGCSSTCKPGCRAAGVNFVYEECRTCCQDDYCNTGDAAGKLSIKLTFLLSAVIMSIMTIV